MSYKFNMSKVKVYINSILIPVIIGGIVGLIISKFIDYDSLIKPSLSPSGKIFPIMWTILYVLMGISYGILKDKKLNDSNVKTIYYIQLAVNAVWSLIFFVLKARLFSAFWIVLLDILVLIMVCQFYKRNKTSGLLQLPYLIWVLFATYLNWGIYFLNR